MLSLADGCSEVRDSVPKPSDSASMPRLGARMVCVDLTLMSKETMEEIMKVSEKALYRRPLVNCCWPSASQFGHVYCSSLWDVLCMCPLADFNAGPFAAF